MSETKAKKTSPWIQHVKNFAEKNKINYAQALGDPRCKQSYKKVGGSVMVGGTVVVGGGSVTVGGSPSPKAGYMPKRK